MLRAIILMASCDRTRLHYTAESRTPNWNRAPWPQRTGEVLFHLTTVLAFPGTSIDHAKTMKLLQIFRSHTQKRLAPRHASSLLEVEVTWNLKLGRKSIRIHGIPTARRHASPLPLIFNCPQFAETADDNFLFFQFIPLFVKILYLRQLPTLARRGASSKIYITRRTLARSCQYNLQTTKLLFFMKMAFGILL